MSLLLVLSFGMVEFGYCFYCKNMLVDAAREGVRNAITPSSSTASVTTAVSNALAATNWPTSYYQIAITDTSGNAINPATVAVGSSVEVTVSGSWGTLGQGFSPLGLIGSTHTIRGVCVMRKEQ
jgi:Flp pilus assembly protein TadG